MKELEVIVSSKSTCIENVVIRVWEDSEHRVKKCDTEVLTCWFGVNNDKVHGVTQRGDG